jgi:hypothetical protein
MTYAIFGSYKLLLTQHVFPYYIFGIVGKRCIKVKVYQQGSHKHFFFYNNNQRGLNKIVIILDVIN